MYYTRLPDHTSPGFNENAHFSLFKKNNIIFNATSSQSHCDKHVGCLSLKTVVSGQEWYSISNRWVAVRPGQFLILNDDQQYGCRIDKGIQVHTRSVFFKKEFASAVFHDALRGEEALLDRPFAQREITLEFFQTLQEIDHALQLKLSRLIEVLEKDGHNSDAVDEQLVFMLHHLIRVHRSDKKRQKNIRAIKPATKKEVFKRLCIAKDLLHSRYMDKIDLTTIGAEACISVPQLVRHFKSVFKVSPYQYLIQIRLQQAEELLKKTEMSVSEIAWKCGFENVSAFCRAFKSARSMQPLTYRNFI